MTTKQSLVEIRARVHLVLSLALLGAAMCGGGFLYYWTAQAARAQGAQVGAERLVYATVRILRGDTAFLSERRTELMTITAAGAAVGGLAGLALVRIFSRGKGGS